MMMHFPLRIHSLDYLANAAAKKYEGVTPITQRDLMCLEMFSGVQSVANGFRASGHKLKFSILMISTTISLLALIFFLYAMYVSGSLHSLSLPLSFSLSFSLFIIPLLLA